jgi:hypothetical protein
MLIFGPGENELAEIIFGGPLRIWNLTNGQPRDIERQANEQLMRFVVDPAKTRERRIVASYGNRVVLSEPQSFKPIAEPICPQGSYSVPVFSSDGRKVLTLSGTFWTAFETVRVWRTDLPVASAEAKSVQFDGKSPPPWLPDLAEAVSGQRVTPDEESPWTNTLDAIAAKATPAEGQYKVIWERYFQPEASMKR